MSPDLHAPTFRSLLRWPRLGLAAVLVAATALTAVLTDRSPAEAASPDVLFGAHVNPRDGLNQYDSIERFETKVDRKLAVVNRYHLFSHHTYRDEAKHLAAGRTPMISWRATDKQADADRAAKIAAGQFDQTIRDAADAVRALRGTVLLRFNWEMDQNPGQRQYIGEPAEFIAAWRRIHGIFERQGATNAQFVWAPRANAFNKGTAQEYYPGDAYVDWIGGSAVPLKSFRDFSTIFNGLHDWGSARGKPLLAWIGVQEKPDDSTWKKTFFTRMQQTLENDMRGFRAITYYHALSPLGYEFWADTSAGAFSAFKTMACDPYFSAGYTCGSTSSSTSPSTTDGSVTFSGSGSADGASWFVHDLPVSATGTIDLQLDWEDAAADLNLFLRPPGERSAVAWDNGSAKPKRLTHEADVTGTWTVAVKIKSGSTAYTVTATTP